MSVPDDRKYLDSHEWFKLDGDVVTMGISQFAADELTDITYVDVPDVGTHVQAGDVLGEVESVKATSEIYAGVGGEVIEVNKELEERPELVNEQAFEGGWMVRLKIDDPAQLDRLLGPAEYARKIS